MAEQSSLYKHTHDVDYLGDFPGANPEKNRVKIIHDGDIGLESGTTVDLADGAEAVLVDSNGNVIEEPLDVSGATVTVTDDGSLAISSLPEPLDVSASTVTVTDNGSLAVSSLPEPLDVSSSTVPVQEQTTPSYPESETTGHDLIGTGDLSVGPVSVSKTEALIISAHSTDSNSWSASVQWQDSNGNNLPSEAASDINLSSVTSDWARLVRKGAQATVTFTDTSGGSSNNLNAFVDTHS